MKKLVSPGRYSMYLHHPQPSMIPFSAGAGIVTTFMIMKRAASSKIRTMRMSLARFSALEMASMLEWSLRLNERLVIAQIWFDPMRTTAAQKKLTPSACRTVRANKTTPHREFSILLCFCQHGKTRTIGTFAKTTRHAYGLYQIEGNKHRTTNKKMPEQSSVTPTQCFTGPNKVRHSNLERSQHDMQRFNTNIRHDPATYSHQHCKSRSARVSHHTQQEEPSVIVSWQLVPSLVRSIPTCKSRLCVCNSTH